MTARRRSLVMARTAVVAILSSLLPEFRQFLSHGFGRAGRSSHILDVSVWTGHHRWNGRRSRNVLLFAGDLRKSLVNRLLLFVIQRLAVTGGMSRNRRMAWMDNPGIGNDVFHGCRNHVTGSSSGTADDFPAQINFGRHVRRLSR